MKKKLIEVALPLEAINRESSHEKSVPRRGHPATMHLWWARRPLAACRAILFASLVDDPSEHPDRFPTESAQEAERTRLFDLMEELCRWENSENQTVLSAARAEIAASAGADGPPLIVDPFSGGGTIPLEARRLGLDGFASDLNPVAALISAQILDYAPRFAGRSPLSTNQHGRLADTAWPGTSGLGADIRHFGELISARAAAKVGMLYPTVALPNDYGGASATVTAWLWCRTIRCSNPACGAELPMVRSFAISTKRGKEARVEPVLDRSTKTVSFRVHRDANAAHPGTKIGRGASFRCLFCGEVSGPEWLRSKATSLPTPIAFSRSLPRGRVAAEFTCKAPRMTRLLR